jgi:hypothetical protein
MDSLTPPQPTLDVQRRRECGTDAQARDDSTCSTSPITFSWLAPVENV